MLSYCDIDFLNTSAYDYSLSVSMLYLFKLKTLRFIYDFIIVLTLRDDQVVLRHSITGTAQMETHEALVMMKC